MPAIILCGPQVYGASALPPPPAPALAPPGMMDLAASRPSYQVRDMNATYVASEAMDQDNVCSIAEYTTGEPWW